MQLSQQQNDREDRPVIRRAAHNPHAAPDHRKDKARVAEQGKDAAHARRETGAFHSFPIINIQQPARFFRRLFLRAVGLERKRGGQALLHKRAALALRLRHFPMIAHHLSAEQRRQNPDDGRTRDKNRRKQRVQRQQRGDRAHALYDHSRDGGENIDAVRRHLRYVGIETVEQISAVILFEACVIGAERPEKQLIFKLHRNFRAALFGEIFYRRLNENAQQKRRKQNNGKENQSFPVLFRRAVDEIAGEIGEGQRKQSTRNGERR